jgi:phage/plasmid-associated DNA primase
MSCVTCTTLPGEPQQGTKAKTCFGPWTRNPGQNHHLQPQPPRSTRRSGQADDLLTFRNGILNVRNFIERHAEYFIPPTAKLFYEHQAQFDFDPHAPCPAEWHRFLDSLERSDTWRMSLQQIMGYCLWLGYDLQKFFVLVGPPRSGKGTIATVLESLVGGESAV